MKEQLSFRYDKSQVEFIREGNSRLGQTVTDYDSVSNGLMDRHVDCWYWGVFIKICKVQSGKERIGYITGSSRKERRGRGVE
jgi:hypothetical protein